METKWIPFNINEYVRVKLNDAGRKIYIDHYAKVGIATKIPKTDHPDGWSQFQMWSFMEIFGEHIHLCSEPPFDTNIEIGVRQ